MSSDTCRATGGWIAGCGAATAVISIFGLVGAPTMGPAATGIPVEFTRVGIGGMPVFVPLVFVFTCVLTGIPAALAIWLSRRFRIRSLLFFGCVGAAIGALSQSLLLRSFFPLSWLFVVAGFAAGLAYWHVAGKYAGCDGDLPGGPA